MHRHTHIESLQLIATKIARILTIQLCTKWIFVLEEQKEKRRKK